MNRTAGIPTMTGTYSAMGDHPGVRLPTCGVVRRKVLIKLGIDKAVNEQWSMSLTRALAQNPRTWVITTNQSDRCAKVQKGWLWSFLPLTRFRIANLADCDLLSLQICSENWKKENFKIRSDLFHQDLRLVFCGRLSCWAKRLGSCGWRHLLTSHTGSDRRSAVRNLAENRASCLHLLLHVLSFPSRPTSLRSGRIWVDLLDRRRRWVVGSLGDLLVEQLRCELGRGSCEPAIAPCTISFGIHDVTTFAFLRVLGREGSGVELVVGLPPNWHDLIWTCRSADPAGDRLGWAQPCLPCQRGGTRGSFHRLGMLHLSQSLGWHDLWFPHQQLRSSLHVEVALLHVGDEHHHAANLIFTAGDRSFPPSLMDCGELRKLFRLFRTFYTSTVLPHRLDGLDQGRSRDVGDSEPRPWDRSPGALQVDPVVRVPEPELHTIGVVAHCICRRPWTTSQLKPRSGRITCDHGAGWPHWVSATTALKAQNWDSIADEHGNHHREPRLALVHLPDQVLIHELLLDCQVCVWPESSEDPVEQDLVPIVDLHVRVAGRRVSEHGPRKRLKSRMWQSMSCLSIPSSTSGASHTLDQEGQNNLDPVQGVVGKKSHWKTWTRRHHLVPLREHVDRAGSVSHDLWYQPGLKRRHHPIIAAVNNHDRCVFRELVGFVDRHQELWHLDLVGIVGTVGGSAPLLIVGAPSTAGATSATITRHGWKSR